MEKNARSFDMHTHQVTLALNVYLNFPNWAYTMMITHMVINNPCVLVQITLTDDMTLPNVRIEHKTFSSPLDNLSQLTFADFDQDIFVYNVQLDVHWVLLPFPSLTLQPLVFYESLLKDWTSK